MTQVHSMKAIETMMAKPMQKAEIPAVPMDSRMLGATLAAEIMATLQIQAKVWHGFAWRLIDMPTDGRLAFQAAIKKQLDDMKAANEAAHGKSKDLDKFLRSATVQVSNLNTICKAWNAGATVEGLCEFLKVEDPRNAGWMKVVEYARTFTSSEAGRPRQAIKVKLQNFLKMLGKDEANFTADDAINYTRAVEFVESLR